MKTHIVQPGEENLEIIAKKYNLNPGDLAIYNRIANNDNLVPGQEIKLELPKDAKPIVVRLGKNDTLETVAKQFNTSVDRLMALNNLPNTNVSEGATLVAWDPFRMNYTNISKAEDLDTLAKQLNTSKDLLLKSNPHVDPNDIKPNTSLFVPWQLNRYVEPPKETKTYSPPKEAPKEEPVDEVPPKTEPLKVDKVPAYAGEKEGEFLLKNYYDHHVFLTEKPTMKPSNWWDKLWGFNDLYREREKEKYIKDITDELLKATNDAFKAYKKAEKEGDRYEMQKQLTWIDNTHKEFERITGIKKGFDPAVVVKDIMRPEARIAEEEANKMEKELALLRAKETDIAGLPESVLSDDEALLDYSTDTFENLNEVQTEGIKKGYIVRKDIDPKTVNPESIDAIINYSGFSLTDKAKSMLDDFKKANDIPYDISKLSENLTKYFGEFNTDISNALYEQDYNKRVKNQKEFLRKYEDLAIVHEQINPNFLKYNQLYLDYSDLNNKIENILLDLKSINNSDIILEALTSGNLEAYKERLDSLGIKQSDIAKVGNLLSEYEAYSDKIVAIQSGFSQINQDLENDLELFTKALNNFDTNLNIKEFFISEANPTSEFGKSIKSLATLSFEASKLRGSTIEDNKRLVEFQDFLNWYQSYVEAATSNFNAISLLNIRNDMWQNISGLTEQRKSEAKNFANWFNPKYNDITFGERAYTTFVESLVNLTKVPVVGDVAEKVFSALDWYNNVALVEYVFPVAKTYRSTVDMAGWLLPRKLELEANLLVGNYSEEEKERQRREFEEKFQQQAETRFGLKDYDLRNIDLVWSHFATGSLEKKVIPIYDSNGNMMKDSNGNIMTSEIFYNKIRLQRDWDLFEVLKKGNRLDLLQDIRDLNEGKDLRNLKAGDYINLPKLDYGSRGPLIRGGEDFWWSPQDYFENAITNPTATEGVNQLVEIFLDPGTYILKSPYALAKGSIVSPIKFLTGKNIKGLSAITNEALIAVHKALEHNFSFPTFEKFFPKIQDLHASWNKKVIEGIEAFAPKEKKATSWWQIPAQIDAIQGKILNIVKSYPVSRLAIEGISNTIDLFSKPVDLFSFKLLTEANSSVLNIFDNFKLDYLSDHVPTTKTVFNKIKEHQVVSVNLSSGKKIVGVVNRAPSGAGLRGSIRTKGKDIILDSNSFDVKLKDGTVVTVYEKNVSDIFTFNSKEVREMTTSWKKTNPKEKYFYDTIKYNLPGIKVNKVNTFNLKKGDYIVSGQDIGSVVSVKDNKVKIKTFDNNENLIEKEIIPTKKVSLIDEEYIKNFNFNWKNAYANTLLPLKKALAVTTGGIQWFIDYLALGTLLNRLPFELRARANNLINKATVTLIAKSSLSATEIWKYFADAFEDSQRRYLLTRKLRIDNKWVELKWNEVWNSKTKKIEVVENPDKKFVLEEKFRSLLLEPGGASLDDWKILSKYNVYPSDIYKAIQKLLTRLSRGDEVANLLKQKSDLINDLIKVLDVNNLNLEGRRISSHFNEDWNKYLIKKGITSRKVREDIVHAANDFGKKIANIDDENLISTARNEIKQIYGEFVSKEAEAVWNIYKEYVSDLLEKQKTQIDSVIVDLPAGVDITFESVEKKLGRLDEAEPVEATTRETELMKEAKKYKSAEEFVKAQELKETGGRFGKGEVTIKTTKEGDVFERYNFDTKKTERVGSLKDVKPETRKEYIEARNAFEKSKGTGAENTKKSGDRYFEAIQKVKNELLSDEIKTKSQLTDIWNKAQEKKETKITGKRIPTLEIVFQKRTFVNRGGEPVYVFEPGAKKADMIEAIGRLSYEEKLLQVNEKILEGFNVAKIIEDFYEDAFIGNKKIYKLYKDYLAVNKKAELPDFIAWVDTYQSLKRSDFSSYKLLKDTISKQIKGSSPSDKLRLELMELLDSKFPLLRTHDYTKTVDTLLNAKRMSDKAFSDAAKVLDHYLNKRRHPVVLSNKKFMVIDTETTGLNVAKDDAFQFSWKIIDGDGKVIDTHNYYRAFDSKFTEAKFLSEDALKAQKVHGITIEKLKESNPKDIKEIINAFAESISSVDSIIAHNSDFDIEFIKKAIEEADGSPDAIFRGIDIIDTNKRNVIDKGWEGGKLDDLYRKYKSAEERSFALLDGDFEGAGFVNRGGLWIDERLPAKVGSQIDDKLAAELRANGVEIIEVVPKTFTGIEYGQKVIGGRKVGTIKIGENAKLDNTVISSVLRHEAGHGVYFKLTPDEQAFFRANYTPSGSELAHKAGGTGGQLAKEGESFADFVRYALEGTPEKIPPKVRPLVEKYASQTKSQLIDIWNKANETKFQELSNEDALIDIYKKALREGKLNERIFKSQEKNIYNNLVKLRDQLDVFQKRIDLPVGIGKQFNFVATKTLTPERIKVIREEVARNLFNQESERLFNLSTEDIVKKLSIPGAISKAIKDGQVAHSPRKNIIGDFKDKNIRDILFFNQDKFKEIDSKIKKINKDLEKGKLTSVEKKKLIKELDTLNFEKSQYDPIKNNLPENSGIRVISEDYVPDEKELADLKKLIDDGWRFVVYSKSRSRLSNDPPAVKLLRSLGLAEEYQMKSPEAAGKLFDFYVYNTKSNKLLSRDLVGITSEYVDEYTTVPGILGILYRSTDSKEYIVSLYKKLSKKLKTVDPEEDITKVINSSYFFDTIYIFVIRNKNIFKGKEFEEFLPRFRFLKNLRKAKSSPDVSILMINSIENLKLNNVNVDVVLLGKLNKEQLKAVNHFNDVIEMEELNLSPNIRLEDKINKTREIKKYNDEISIKLEAEDKVAYPKIELTNEDLNAVKKIIDDVSSKVFDDLTPLKKFVKNQDIDIEKSLIDGENISIESYVNKLFKETEEDYRALRFSEFEITKKGSEEEPLAGSSGDLIKHTFDRWIDDQLDILNIVSYEDLDTIKSLMKSIGAKEQIRENFQGKKVFVYEISLNDAYYYRVKGLDPNALIHKPKVTKKEYLNVKTSYIVPGVYGGKTVNFVFGDGSFIIRGHYGHFKNVDNRVVYSVDTSPENIKKLDLKDGDIIYTNTTMAENFKEFNATDAVFPVKVKEYNGDYSDEPSNVVDLTRGGRKKDLYNIYIVKNEKLRKPRIENVYTGKAYDGSGYHIKGKDGKFYDKKGYDPDGYDIDGFNRDGFDRKGFDKNGYNIDGLDALGFDKDGFHWFNGLNKDGTKHKSGVSKSEYNKFLLDITGYGLDGFDLKGFSKNKYHIDDYKKTGFGPDGRDKLGFDKNKVNSDGIHINEYKYKKGFGPDGRDKLGFDKKDINRYGYHRDVYKKNVYDFDGYDIYGFNKDGFNRKNKHKSSYERNDLNSDKELRENGYIGYDRNGRDIYGFDRDGFDKNGNHIGEYLNDGFAKDGYNIYNFDRDGFHRTKRYHKNDYINGFGPNGKDVYGFGRDGFNDKGINIKGERKGFDPDGYNKDGYDREGYDRKGFDRSGYDRDGYNLRMEHKDGGYNLDTLRSIIEKNIDTEKKSYYLLDDVGWRNDKYSDVSFIVEEMPSLDLPNQHSEVIVPKRATITETIEVKEEFPDSFAIKKEDGTSMFIEGNTKTKINNIIFKSKSTGDYSLFFPPKFLFDFDKIDLDRTRLIKKLLPEDSPKTDYIVIDVPNNSYINKLKKDLDTLDLDALKKYDLEKDIEKAIKERDSADAFEKVIKETDELKGIKIYRISSIEGIALEENLESINKFRDSRFNKENGLFISSNPDKTKDFLDFKLFTPRESKILENMNNVFTEIKDLVRSEKLHGKSAFYTKQFSIFSEPVNLDKSIESLVRNIERGAAVDDLEKVILETVTKTKRAWDGKNVVVIALDDATSLTGEFYEAINDIIEKNKRLKTKTKILFPDHPNLLERDAKAYLLSRGFDENLIGVVDLDHVPVAKTYKDFKITDQTKAIKDLINLQNEKMSRASYSLVIGKIEDDVAGIIPKRLLLAQNSKEAGILVMSDNLILKDQINVMKGFLVENTDSAYKFPSAGIRDELFNKKITFQRALEKTIIASSRKEFQKEWVKFINEETNAYRETVESQYKPYLAGGSNIELELYREMVEEQVQRFRDAFKPIEKYILKWDGSEPVLDKYLRSARERVLKDLINDIAEGKRDRAIFENYLEKGDVPTVGYFLRKNLGYNTTKFLIALPGYLQTIFIQSVLRLMPRWSINNALDDLIKTLIFDRDFKKFLSGIWLQGKIFVNFYGTLLKHGKIDVSNSIMSNFFRLQKKLGIINNKEFNLKIRKLPKKGFYDLSELLKEWGHEDWSKMIRYIDDITIVKKDKKGKSILDKEGREVSQTYSAIDLDYMMSTGIQEIYSSPEEALLYFKRIIPKNANPLERIGFKAKEWNANLDMFYSQTERLRRAIALQRALQDQTIDMAKAKAFVSDFFFDYKAVNRAGVFFRKFFPFFTFSYFTARLYLKLLLGRYGYQTFRAGVAIMQIWEANTAHLPEMYKDRISIKIGDREFLIRPNISLIDVMRFVFDPSKEIEQTFENPRKLFFGLGYGPIVGPIVEELTGATYFKPSESEMKAMGWNYGEIKKELQKYEDSKAGETWIDTWWKLVYSIVPHIEIIEKLFFKADVEFQQTGNILKSSKFREISKMFAINILERDAVDAFTQKLYSLPPSVRNYYINQIKESDPELYEEWQRQSLISLNNNLIVKGVSEEERIRTLDKRRAQNEYYRLEAQEKGAGSEWLDKNPYQKELLEEVWRDSPKSAYDEYREKLRLIDEDRRTIRQIVEETLPSNLENEKNIERYKALGYDYQPVNRDKLIKDLTNKDLNIHQMNVLLAYKYPDVGLDFIRKSQIDQKRAESEEYKALSLEEKKELSLADQAYYKKINILNRFLPDKDATEEEVQKAFELRKKQIDKIFTPEEKKRYLDSIPESQKILEKAMTDYIERWGKIIENSEDGKYWESLNSQPSWFKEFYFLNNPEVRVYLPLALEREKRLGEVIEMEKRGFSTIKERKALNDWFWAHEKEIKAWESHSPETIERYRERKEYDENFYFPLQSFANIKNWQGYYNFLLSPSNKKYLDMWSRMGSSERTEEQIKEEAEQKIKMAKLSKEYYSLPSTTWNDQKKKQEWLNNNSELRDWWDRNKSKEELELSKKAQVYFDMKFDIEDEGSGYDYYLKFREINVKRQDYLNNNPDVLKYINSNEEGTLLEPSTIKRKLAIYNTLSDEKKREYLDNNKDLAKYFLDGVPSGIRKVRELQEEYFNIKESQFKTKDEFYDARNKFLKDNPNLKKYWDAMAMPSSYFLDKQKFNKYQIDLSKVLKYYDSISANNLSDSMRISLLNMNSYMVPGNSEEDKWMMNKVYESAMQTWIRLLDENKSVGMYFFRQLPTWIRARYYDNHPDKRVLSNYSLNQWFGQPIWRYNKNNPSVNWALEQQRKYGKNIPISIKRQVEKILISAGEWEDRSSWTSEKWKEWQTDRAARLNGLKQKDVDTNPLLRKELYRATVFFKRNAPIDPKIYNKKIKFMNLPDNSVFLL